jgi:UDPglucose 6-dehydrogenase
MELAQRRANMKIAVFGTGYVGLVTGTCFAEMGHKVVCVDIDADKIDNLNKGRIPIYEPGLENMVKENFLKGNLSFTVSAEDAIENSEVIFIGVGTPCDENGRADLTGVMEVAASIAKYANEDKDVVIKSTVPPGTNQKVSELLAKYSNHNFQVFSNPEFLKEGSAVDDCMRPDRVIIGCDNLQAANYLGKALYTSFVRNNNQILCMNAKSAELTKYAANSMLATKISFINEMAKISSAIGADIEDVRKGIGTDPRIGPHFIYAGIGYGGSCFPKDVKALKNFANDLDIETRILHAVEYVNVEAIDIVDWWSIGMQGATITFWGAAFKPNTDDVRDSPMLRVARQVDQGIGGIRVYDPKALANLKEFEENEVKVNSSSSFNYFHDQYDALDGADYLVIATEWKQFYHPDFNEIKRRMNKNATIIDGRNIYDPEEMRELGFNYISVGRPPVEQPKESING